MSTETLLPCPLCSSVQREGVHRKPVHETPMWTYASNTSRKNGEDHFCWLSCKHAKQFAPDLPTKDREPIEAKWNAHARELLEQRCAGWAPHVREEFEILLGFRPRPPAPGELFPLTQGFE